VAKWCENQLIKQLVLVSKYLDVANV